MPGLATQAGFILGTAAYMSPEQARGKPADKRADIWAFGVVLYEMLTGRPLYAGETAAEILAGVIEREPDLSALPAATPPSIRELLGRCLTKDPRNRLQAIGEARIAIDRAVDSPIRRPSTLRPAARRWRRRYRGRAGPAPRAAGVDACGPGSCGHRRARRPGHPVLPHCEVAGPEETWQIVTPPTSHTRSFAISPDGLRLVFSATVAGKAQLWIRPLCRVDRAAVAGHGGRNLPLLEARQPGHWFLRGQEVEVDPCGGRFDDDACAGGSRPGWVVEPERRHPLCASSDQTAVAGLVESRQSAGRGHPVAAVVAVRPLVFPWFLPDGRHFLYQATGNAEGRGVYIGALDSPEGRRLIDADGAAVYAPPGFLLFARQGSLARPTLRSRDVGAHRADVRRRRASLLQRRRLPAAARRPVRSSIATAQARSGNSRGSIAPAS